MSKINPSSLYNGPASTSPIGEIITLPPRISGFVAL
jgi:hypothetical protein